MNKNFKIWGVRSSLAGDLVMALPVLNYLELKYPNSYKYWAISKRYAQFAPLFFNHPMIDRIKILDDGDSLGQKDIEITKSCDIILDVNPQHPDGMPATTEKSCWWNYYNHYEETFRMAGFDAREYIAMSKEFRIPYLNQWFNVKRYEKTIAIWPFTSYGAESKRSPSKVWWGHMIENINKLGYNVLHFGGLNEPDICINNSKYTKLCSSPVFEQYQLSLGCDLCINTSSGCGIILGAYGARQITVASTNEAPNHFQNPTAFSTINWKNNNINLLSSDGCDNINQDEIIELIKQL